jgi:hypothetical protein
MITSANTTLTVYIALNVLIMLILKNLKLRVLASSIIGADRKLKRQVNRSSIDPID